MTDIQAQIDAEITQALNDMGLEILNIWKAQVPVKTGKLKNSIQYRVVRKRGELALSFYYLQYGVFVDLGTYSNADQEAYGVSAFDLPAWNARPQRSGKGIAPRYWTSLSSDKAELEEYLTKKLETIMEASVEELIDRIQSRTQRNTA